jgi:DNA-binding transcriptional ArsR family regulator
MKHEQNLSATELAERLKVLGDPHRMKILCVLFAATPVCVTSVAQEVGVSVAVASHHLRALAAQEILEPVRDGKHVCYRLASTAFARDIKRFIAKYHS